MPLKAVVTTIQPPTDSLRAFARKLEGVDAELIVVGDAKGPLAFDSIAADFYSLDRQKTLPFSLLNQLPVNSYTRKNIGYLLAIQHGATCIYETDDDNTPLVEWLPREEVCYAEAIQQKGWVNVYRLFSDERIWPRGFPLQHVRGTAVPARSGYRNKVRAPVQQGLANGSPDVDAVWRMTQDRYIRFDQEAAVLLKKDSWCPFNSQSTWWRKEAFPLMYLPSMCSFRMTDIWRSFVAQRCLWETGSGVVFHAAEVEQRRNEHNLLKDFEHEVDGYLGNERMAEVLQGLTLGESIEDNLFCCYEALVREGFLPEEELGLVRLWLNDLRTLAT